MKKATKTNNHSTRNIWVLAILIAVTATVVTLFLCSTMLEYCLIKDNFSYAVETAGKLGWSTTLVEDANNAQNALKVYAESNWFAGILYFLNGSFIKKLIQAIIIIAAIVFSAGAVAFDAYIGFCIVSNVHELKKRRNHRKSNIYPISEGRKRHKRNSHNT